jgi:type 1 fimbria pilin
MTIVRASIKAQARRTRQSLVWRLSILVGGVCLALLAPPVMAACTGNNQSAGSVTFAPPVVIQLPANLSPGTTIWTSPQAIPGNPVTLSYCDGGTTSGLENAKWGPPTGTDQTLFPTNYPWLAYRILHPDPTSILQAWPNQPIASNGGGVQFTVGSALALIVTGPVPPGTHSLAGGLLTQWDVDTGSGRKQTVELFNVTTSTISLVPPTCAILIDPTVVTLPAIAPAALPNNGSTAGQTPFNIRLNCQAYNRNLQITLATAVYTGSNNQGIISPTTGAGVATNVGIQLLQGPICTTPVIWNQAISEGNPINGEMDLPFCAQYYHTQTTKRRGQYPVTSGNVTGTATYTLNYQ